MRLIISCGGTGGHFNPGLGIARYVNSHDGESLLILGGPHAPKQLVTASESGVKAQSFRYERPGKNPVQMLKFFFAVIRGYRFAKKMIREFKPDAMLIMGSSVSLPAALAARRMKLPIFLHDGNARVGKANRFLSRWAKAIALSFPAANAETLRCKSVLTGLPLREPLLAPPVSKAEAVARFNEMYGTDFDAAKPLMLVFGGSLGAQKINECFDADPSDPAVKDLQVIMLTGPGKLEEMQKLHADFPGKICLREASPEMHTIYSACDVVISRSGGSTVSELAYFGKYALLIPYPFAAELHQNDNAAYLASGGGAEILMNEDVTRERMREFVSRFLADRGGCIAKGEQSKRLAFPDAAGAVLQLIRDNL